MSAVWMWLAFYLNTLTINNPSIKEVLNKVKELWEEYTKYSRQLTYLIGFWQ
jgi:hypothetical protein